MQGEQFQEAGKAESLEAMVRTGDFLKEGERLDDLQLQGLRIIQNPEKFCFGMDAVLLSSFAKAGTKDKVVDFCTGTGILPILMSAKTSCQCFYALEIQEESVQMAKRSVELNQLQNRITIMQGDIKEASSLLGKASFDVVTVNPPYMNENHGIKNPELPKAIARHEILCTLEDVVREGAAVLKESGHFFMVHRPHRLAEIVTVLSKYRLEMKRMRLVYPYIDKEPNMVLLEAVKGGRSYLKNEPPLIVYRSPGKYTEEIYNIYGFSGK